MASNMMLDLFTAQQPITMSGEQILDLISVAHVPADEEFDAHSLFLLVENILKRATHIVDIFSGQEDPKNLEEKVSRASFDPLLSTLKKLSSEMALKAPGVEIAHKTTISILDKLSSYSWNARAVLALAAFALDYEDFSALTELPKHDHWTILQLNGIINDTLDIMKSIFELNSLFNNDTEDEPEYVYWIIIAIVACKTQLCSLTKDEDKTQDQFPLAQNITATLIDLKSKIEKKIEEKKARKLKELLQKPDEIMEVFKGLVSSKDDLQSFIDGSTNEMVSIDVLKKKNVLLLISNLDISGDDISILMPIYDGIREKGDQYKIVWIPALEQWTDDLRNKFEMLRSKMPWYIVQYSSPIAGIKFIKEEWHFDNEPIVVVMNPQGDVENKDALNLIRTFGMMAFPFISSPIMTRMRNTKASGPYATEECTFIYGGDDYIWVQQFKKKVVDVSMDPVIETANIFIGSSLIPGKQGRWATLVIKKIRIVSNQATKILTVLQAFDRWKMNIGHIGGFEKCFKQYHDKLL